MKVVPGLIDVDTVGNRRIGSATFPPFPHFFPYHHQNSCEESTKCVLRTNVRNQYNSHTSGTQSPLQSATSEIRCTDITLKTRSSFPIHNPPWTVDDEVPTSLSCDRVPIESRDLKTEVNPKTRGFLGQKNVRIVTWNFIDFHTN